jgi:hypothetical protein
MYFVKRNAEEFTHRSFYEDLQVTRAVLLKKQFFWDVMQSKGV